MLEQRAALTTGMEVVDIVADRIGYVKQIRDVDFLVDRPMKRDLYVPFHAVKQVQDDIVVVDVITENIADMGWEHPPLVGGAS